jgi:hypothetical protein
MHLVGYLYEDYHEALSLEHKVLQQSSSLHLVFQPATNMRVWLPGLTNIIFWSCSNIKAFTAVIIFRINEVEGNTQYRIVKIGL